MGVGEEGLYGKGTGKGDGCEVGMQWRCLGNGRLASVAGAEKEGDKGAREVRGRQSMLEGLWLLLPESQEPLQIWSRETHT